MRAGRGTPTCQTTGASPALKSTTQEAPHAENVRVDVLERDEFLSELAQDVRAGLSNLPKELPPKYFYDERGSRLFEDITALPEYYPARAEQEILDRVGAEIVDLVEPQELVELGPGSARKTEGLLGPMIAAGHGSTYVPVDVSESAVRDGAARLTRAYEGLEIHGVVGDFEQDLERLRHNGRRRLVAFLGGTLGNFDRGQRRAFLARIRTLLGEKDRLLIGTDLVKDKATLEAAYNDSAGVTAEFNRNVLGVINENLGGDLDPSRFDHVARYREDEQRIEMRLRSRELQTARIDALDMDVRFERGEDILTEISCKFTREGLTREYAAAGLEVVGWHTDAHARFALSLTAPR
jgi:L-histidine N-alpha-methyltransferase